MVESFEHNGITRRRFLNVSLATAGSVIALGARRSCAGRQREQTRWAFLSDTHIAGDPQDNVRGQYPYRNLRATFRQIAEDLPEGLVVTGDIARLKGQMEDYENFRKLMIPLIGRRPMYFALGNHDDRDAFLDVFETLAAPKPPVKGKHIVTVDAGPARFIFLDSLLKVNETPGFLGKA